ncbi:MAG: DUF2938 domain-containing protein [bacterium]|nr:DUF2938 domain-containing protein [bacterium]
MIIIILKTLLIGIGATLAIDIWVSFLKLFKIKSLDYKYVGRWVGNFPKGKFFHNKIQDAPQISHELFLGWTVHYLIGISFAFILIAVYGVSWLYKPTFFPAVIIGLITSVGPFFIMQPAFGFGIASAKLPNPNLLRLKSLGTHLIYGIGLYVSAILLNEIL